jgi:site-specific recombinase XerC
MTIDEALERFIVQLAADGRSEHTIGQYRRHIRLLGAWARDGRPRRDRVADLDHEAIAGFLAAPCATVRDGRGGQKLATSMNALRTSVKVFLAYCHRAGYVRMDPGRLIRRAITSPPPPKGLSPEEERRLLATIAAAVGPEAERDQCMFALMLASGIRLGSVVALRVEDVDLEGGELAIHGKGDRRNRVLLGRRIQDHLRRFIGKRVSGTLFARRGGQALTPRHVNRRLKMWAARAGLARRVHAHQLRHAFAIRVYARCQDVLVVKEALCHRSIASTLVYARVDEGRLRRAL